MTTTTPRPTIRTVYKALDAGLTLEIPGPHGMRQFDAGQITKDRRSNGSVRTTHSTEDGMGYVWLTKEGIRQLAEQAAQKLANKDEILADRDARLKAARGQ